MARTAVTAVQVRAAMFGREVAGLEVVRQARRVREDHTDELALLDAGGTWWVARRTGDAVAVWVYIGDTEAEDGFERLVAAADRSASAWREAEAELLTPADPATP